MEKLSGLSAAEVGERIANGQTNDISDRSSRRFVDILRANILTRFNALLLALAIVVLAVGGGPINALFFAIMVVNSGVGIFQELSAKRKLDRLAILAAPKVTVIRRFENGENLENREQEIAIRDVVRDDLIKLKLGDQIVADGEILASEELEIDESLLTGESEPIAKKVGDQVLSGSIVVAGSGIMVAKKVGANSYSAKLTLSAKKFQRAKSELVSGTNKLLKWISWTMVVVAPILLIGQLRIDDGDWRNSVLHSVAALVGMIPEGLVLLTSAAFMLAAIALARKKVLVQQIPAVETLARVDILLLDKTGTLTEGNIRYEATILAKTVAKLNDETKFCEMREMKSGAEDFAKIVDASRIDKTGLLRVARNDGDRNFAKELNPRNENISREKIDQILATIASRAKSPTNDAISKALAKIPLAKFSREIAFSSARKWSAIEINGESFVFGAPEILLINSVDSEFAKTAESFAKQGKRVLVLMRAKKWPEENSAEEVDTSRNSHWTTSKSKISRKDGNANFREIAPIALVILSEKIRESARETLDFFAKQKVDIKIISGDSPLTVAAVAREVGLKNVREFDARDLPKISDVDIENYEDYLKNCGENSRKICEESSEDIDGNFAKKVDASRNSRRIASLLPRNDGNRNFAKKMTEDLRDRSEHDDFGYSREDSSERGVEMTDVENFAKIINEHNIFGRVQPEQKRQIAKILQMQNHVVAMTGDGVNDALALKKADLGIAMASGASATKAVAEIVLMNNEFSQLPKVLAEGRRVIANIERVANLFVIKNVYSLVLALGVTVFGLIYPYLPVQMTVISATTIGIPAFFLALAPNVQIYRAGFLKRVLKFAIPVGMVAALAMLVNYYLINRGGISGAAVGTSVSITLMIIAMTVLVVLSRPLKGWKLGLILACAGIFVTILLVPSFAKIFNYQIDVATLPATFAIGAVGAAAVVGIKRIEEKMVARKSN